MKIKKYIEYFDYNININESKAWLDSMNIKNYTINKDLTVDVDGSINISYKKLNKIPIKFNIINGDFVCSNNKLKNLIGCPNIVKKTFSCNDGELTSLEGCPKEVGKIFWIANNKLTSLENCPTSVGGRFWGQLNPLESIKGLNEKFDLNNLKLEDDTFDITNNIVLEKDYLKWNWLESILTSNPDLITYHIKWIKSKVNTMPEKFKEDFGYLLEFEHYTKTIE